MGLKRVIQLALFVLLGAVVEMSPISSEENRRVSGNSVNDIKNLFFLSDREEQSLENDHLHNAFIEKIKARILNSLHLQEPPKSHPPVPSLQSFHENNNSWDNRVDVSLKESSHKHWKSEFLKSEIVPNTCYNRDGPECLRFQIHMPQKSSEENKSLTELWMYKKEGITEYTIVQIIDDPDHITLQKEILNVFNQTESAGWTRLDVTALTAKISGNVLDLEVYSSSGIPLEIGKDKNPLLVAFTNSDEQSSRSKRSSGVDCDVESSYCCRKKIYISFKEIGWDNWIVQPEGYNANACKGSCQNRLDLTEKHHTHVMLRYISKAGNNYSEIADTIHCSPKVYKPLSIIYTDDKGLKVITNLPDMSVSECACS
ncbi:inhibin beta E chain [Trichonephila inaurata madagascariensis]|uniref:Inhibin beta E chain n=1 Tax=Trichonephila inaurata madagascariensis TaxID=2747483 RepID=A0A8X6YEX0_9ARAC|nr:inhibin beta E chain [Trichonephila inaurata madagascariensis]GFY71635.1 inhibin beta E chain [Trichonephila inaurata madagascariensis]